MQFDVVWFLLALPLAFMLGWLASRFDFRQLQLQNRRHPRAYFRALRHWLHGESDEALSAFEEAVRNDPDTPELQFALGHLYRERGRYTPAVRIHEHLSMRADLKPEERQRAQYALAMDFTRAGILDRAEQALAQLDASPYEKQSRQIRLAIFERLRDWPQAQTLAEQLQLQEPELYRRRLVHYLCERAQEAEPAEAIKLLRQAHRQDPDAPRPLLALALLCLELKMGNAAAEVCHLVAEQHGSYLGLLAGPYVQAWLAQEGLLQGHLDLPTLLLTAYEKEPNQDLLSALLRLIEAGEAVALSEDLYAHYCDQRPSMLLANRWLSAASNKAGLPLPESLAQAVAQAEKPLMRYRCTTCGFEAERHYWHCPGCQAWDSYPPLRVEDQA